MYQNSSAQFRPELYAVTEEARQADKKFIGDLIFPEFGVKTRTGDYTRIKRGKGQLLVNLAGDGSKDPLARAPGTAYPEITRTSEKTTWGCVDRGITTPVDDVNAQDVSRFFDMESASAKWLMRVIRIYREVRIAAKVFNETVWGEPIDSTVAFTAANKDTIDAPELFKAGSALIDKRQEEANTLVISRTNWDLVTGSKKMREYLFGANGGSGSVTLQLIAEKFGFSQILIGNATFDTTKPGKDSSDDNLEYCWNDDYMWIGNVQGGAPENGGAGRTFILEDTTNGGMLYVPESWREEKTRSNQLRIRQDSEENTVSEVSAILIKVNNFA